MRYLIIALTVLILSSCQTGLKTGSTQTQKDNAELEVLLVGTFHFSNFDPSQNMDVAQTNVVDVLSAKNQAELEHISNQIAEFNPDKIFVEVRQNRQAKLDSIYTAFSPKSYKEVKRSELRQLAFRTAKKLKHEKVFACDYRETSFPYKDMLEAMENAKQQELMKAMDAEMNNYEQTFNDIVRKNESLTDCLIFLNEDDKRKQDMNWYVSLANQAGTVNDETGSFLASEWYKRNLYMYSNIQKTVEKGDERIMILSGSSHTAMFKHFIDLNPKWNTIELKEII